MQASDDAQETETLFNDYAEAFSTGNVDGVCSHWAYPAFFIARGKRAALSREQFRSNTAALNNFYRTQGVARAAKSILSFDELFRGLAFVRTADKLTKADGTFDAQWEHGYLVSDTLNGLKIVAAMPDQELDVWARRGTPLGSW